MVVVIDDGFDFFYFDLLGVGKVVGVCDYLGWDSYLGLEWVSGDFYGMFCVGVVIGEENGMGIVGVVLGCSFLFIWFLLSVDDNMFFDIFDYVGCNVYIIFCSWGLVFVYVFLSMFLSNQMECLYCNGGLDGCGCLVFFVVGNYNVLIWDMNNIGFIWCYFFQGLKIIIGLIVNGYVVYFDVVVVVVLISLACKLVYFNWGEGIIVIVFSDNWNLFNQQE